MSKQPFNDLLWFVGVVEDVNDPIASGRVKVRCLNIHPPVGDEVPTEALPWAIPINGSYSSLFKVPEIGEWVFGFFIDGRDAQHPFLLGTIPGTSTALPAGATNTANAISGTAPNVTGANTVTAGATSLSAELAGMLAGLPTNIPTQINNVLGDIMGNVNGYIRASAEALEKFGQHAVPPQISGIDVETTPLPLAELARRVADLGSIGSTPLGGINEPPTAFGGSTSRNVVLHGGYGRSYVEVNGTPDAEHVTMVHTSGSVVQIDTNGNVKIRSLHNMYTGTEGNSGEHVGGRKEVLVEGPYTVTTEGHVNFNIKGDFNIECNDFNVTARGKASLNVAEAIDARGARIALHAKDDNFDLYAAQKIKVFSGGELSAIANGTKIQTTGFELSSEGIANITATGDAILKGNDVRLNAAAGGHFLANDLRMKGGKVSIQGFTVAIDDYVYMASGESDAATGANDASTPDDIAYVPNMVAPPARTVPSNGSAGSTPGGGFSTFDDNLTDNPSSPNATGTNITQPPYSGVTSRAPNPVSIAQLESDPEWNAAMATILANHPGLTKDELYRIIQHESSFNTTATNASGATGLFQFMPATATGLGTSVDAIAGMTAAQQLAVYDRYLTQNNYSGGGLGIMQAAPAYASRSADTVIYRQGSAAWVQNPGWRPANGGDITVASINAFYS